MTLTDEIQEAKPVLSSADRAFFDENGYVVVSNAVPPQNLQAVVDAIFNFLGMNPDNPSDWYRAPLSPGGMIEMYQHQALWDNRQHPRVYQAFREILGTHKLWVSFDRANIKPPQNPARPEYDHKGFTHWDLDTSKLDQVGFGVQGVLCLTDTPPERGGFQCVPGFHKKGLLEDWIAAQPPGRNPHAPDLSRLPAGLKLTPIAAQAGDLIIWNRRLAHGNGHNTSDKPRLAQYITMFAPAAPVTGNVVPEGLESNRQDRIRRWRDRLPPDAKWAPGDPRGWEQTYGKTAELTPLGRKLLGLDAWED